MVGWEYRHGLVGFAEIGQLLNELGEQGWELVQILPAPQYMEVDRRTHFDKIQYFLKRPKAEPVANAKPAEALGNHGAPSTRRSPVRLPIG